MASNAEMRQLILHAAARLAEEDPGPAFEKLLNLPIGSGERAAWATDMRALTAAMVLAESTLRMVAACLADDEPEVPT